MPPLDARPVAGLLYEYGQRTASRGGNAYRAKAYGRAADSLSTPAVPLHCSSPNSGLQRYPGSATP